MLRGGDFVFDMSEFAIIITTLKHLKRVDLTRRGWLQRMAILALAGGAGCRTGIFCRRQGVLSCADDAFLEELERATFRFFEECAHPRTGLVKDRSRADGNDEREVASIAATGFGLTALCIADARGWLTREEARERTLAALRFLLNEMPHEHGFFFHFIHWGTGQRVWECEVSSIDTGLLLAGVLTCRAHFDDAEIRAAAIALYDRIDWRWLARGELLGHGWKPENGFLAATWDSYCEQMLLYLMAIGSRGRALGPESWHAWQRPIVRYRGYQFIGVNAPLFVHQYSHAWFDFRGRRDRYANYFENSVAATRAHRQFCLDLRGEFPHYSEDLWGITASDSARGYAVWGGPPRQGAIDGTLVPCAAAGSLPFLPEECVRCLRAMRERFGERIWKRYGFVDAFNPATGWVNPDVIGIDLGITLLMAENFRTEFVWRTFMRNPEMGFAMRRVGFVR